MTTLISALDPGNLQPLEIFIGFLIVFAVTLLLIFAVKSIAQLRKPKDNEIKDVSEESTTSNLATGSCGDLKLVNTDERTAAMIMAIVANQTETPLNQLRFISIEKKEGDK